MSALQVLWYKINRKKTLDADLLQTPLRRCLTTFDLTLLGIGHMVGAGIFVLTGTVVRDIAGPGAVLSYLFAGLAALLSSLCYAEFGARVPKAGSAYTYTYVTIGEFWAFIIGWNIILEYLLGVASVARAFSGSFDALFNFAIRNATLTHIGRIDVPMLSEYPDIIALVAILMVMVFVAGGAKVSVNFNSFFTIVNLVVILLIITVGFSYSDTINWEDPGHGGFLPYGFQGTLAGAATCFYAYIGFDGIAIAGEEAKHPERSLPIATCLAMGVVTILYMLSSSSLTLLVPYFDVDVAAPFPMAFAERGLNWPKVVVAAGALFGITTSLTGAMFALPRAVYSMASDGLLFAVFSYVHPRTQTPIVGIAVFGLIACVFALLIDINALVEFLSIGTLLSFTMVAAGVIVLRYQTAQQCQFRLRPEEQAVAGIVGPMTSNVGSVSDMVSGDGEDEDPGAGSDRKKMLRASQSHDEIGKLKRRFQELPVLRHLRPEVTTTTAVIAMAAMMVLFHVILLLGFNWVAAGTWWAVTFLVLLAVGIISCFLILLLHEQNRSFMTFQTPLVPLVPTLSMFVNIAMMIKLSYITWIRLTIWLAVGIIIYLFYGQRYSMENKPLSAYSQIVSYAGSNGRPSDSMESSLHRPQMDETPTNRYDQAYEETESTPGQEDGVQGRDQGQYQGQSGFRDNYRGQGQDGRGYQGYGADRDRKQPQELTSGYDGQADKHQGYGQKVHSPQGQMYQDQAYGGLDSQGEYVPIQGGFHQGYQHGYQQGQGDFPQGQAYQSQEQGQGYYPECAYPQEADYVGGYQTYQ